MPLPILAYVLANNTSLSKSGTIDTGNQSATGYSETTLEIYNIRLRIALRLIYVKPKGVCVCTMNVSSRTFASRYVSRAIGLSG